MTHHDDARLDALLAQLGDGDTKDLFRLLLERGMQDLIDAELTATIGAELAPRSRAVRLAGTTGSGGESRPRSSPGS